MSTVDTQIQVWENCWRHRILSPQPAVGFQEGPGSHWSNLGLHFDVFSNRCLRGEKKGTRRWLTSMMYNHCDWPGSTCPSRPNSKVRSHCWPRTKGGLWLWSLAGICTIAGAESPFFLLVLRHRACGVLPAPHTTGLSHSRLQARAAQCQSTWIYQKHTHMGGNKSHAFRLTTKYSPFHVNKIPIYNAQHDLMYTTSVYMLVYKKGQMESCYFQRQSIPWVRTMREEFSDG